MKKTFTLSITLLLVLLMGRLFAQVQDMEQPIVPYKIPNTVPYGSDVLLNDDPTENQRNVCVTVAFNGWLYAAYSTYDGSQGQYFIFRSTDNGETWSTIYINSTSGPYVALDIDVSGNSVAEIVVYLSRIYNLTSNSYLRVSRYDADGIFLSHLVDENLTLPDRYIDVALANDYRYPAWSASPFSVGVAYSYTTGAADYIMARISGNGGSSITDVLTVQNTLAYVAEVSISYGRCLWNSNGRYFVAWRQGGFGTSEGNIYVSHNDPYFNSTFTPPFQLDNIAGSSENLCFNPVISTQFNNVDNDIGYLTAIVLMDRDWAGSGTDFDVIGMYNKDAVNTDNWIRFDIANTSYVDYQSDINFDPGYNNFLVTYCAYTDQKLRYLVQGQNMPDPYNWILISDKYNEDDNLVNPYPKVEINPALTKVAHVWSGERLSGNGIATFDAEYSTVGIPVAGGSDNLSGTVYPNPCSDQATLFLNLVNNERVTATLFSVTGQGKATLLSDDLKAGEHRITFDVTNLAAGYYLLEVRTGTTKSTVRFVVSH